MFGCPAQRQQRDLGTTQIPQRMIARQSTADVQQCRRLVEDATVITTTIATRHQHGAKQRKAYLPAVDMSRQHQVNARTLRPANIIRRVAEAQAERLTGASTQIRFGMKPWAFVANDHERFATYFNLLPAVARDVHAQTAQA